MEWLNVECSRVEGKDIVNFTERVPVYNIDDFPYSFTNYEIHYVRKKRKGAYINIAAAFDIETTTISNTERPYGFMYHWQFCLHNNVCFGRTWEEFKTFLQRLQDGLQLADGCKLAIYCHYLPFEFQFFRNFLTIDNVFALEPRQVVTATAGAFEFRCSYKLSNMSLLEFCKKSKGCTFWKKDGEKFDYSKIRTPSTPLTQYEKEYNYCDVRGLCQALESLLIDDTIATIPLTSTGYVRRDARAAVQENPKNRDKFQSLALNEHTYILCRTARRGGNTHALGLYSNEIISNMKSRDKKSSYPASMLLYDYPMSPFIRIAKKAEIERRIDSGNFACLLDVHIDGLCIKSLETIPYIAKAKCTRIVTRGALFDNGRVISALSCDMVITDVDYRIIMDQYNIDKIEFRECYISDYAPLPREFRQFIRHMFTEKEKLKNGDPYLYAKYKNKINATFGMCLTDICRPDIEYNAGGQVDDIDAKDGLFPAIMGDISGELSKYYKSRNSFLAYQWGVWVTAHSRAALQDGLNAVGRDGCYTDTDSVKYIGNHDADFAAINARLMKLAEERDIPAYIETPNGRIYLGVWETDGVYDKFITLGAKKYAYEENGEVHITVAGLNKEKGAAYVQKKGGIATFKDGLVFPEEYAKRTVSYYNDYSAPYYITVNGERILTGSNIGVVGTTYTLGITDEYSTFIEMAKRNSTVESAEIIF